MLLPRLIVSIIFIPIVVSVIWFGSLPFFVFVTGVSLLAFWEYSLMAEEGGYPNQLYVGLLGVLLVLLSLYLDSLTLWGSIEKSPGPFFIFLFWMFLAFVREIFSRDKGLSVLKISTTVLGVILCSLFMGHLVLIRDLRIVSGEGFQYIGREMTFFLILIIWTTDTGAWGIGRLMGRFPLAPRLSPKKTWEGFIGGVLIACFAGWFLRELFLKTSLGSMEAVIYALLISVTAQISDLSESLIKRTFGAKDSSRLLPGHGGILDRFDSVIFAAPFFYYVLLATGRFQ